jgi:hypothetical protein
MLKENEVVGMIGIFREEVRAFTDKQIALVEYFRRSSLSRMPGCSTNCASAPPI